MPPTELSARRVWLEEGYGGKKERRARIRATLERRYRRAEPIRVLDGMRRNPRAFHVADLRIVPYE